MTNYFIEIIQNIGENWKQFNIIEEGDLDIGNSNVNGSPHCKRFIETEDGKDSDYNTIDKPVQFLNLLEAEGYKKALDKFERERVTAWEKEKA